MWTVLCAVIWCNVRTLPSWWGIKRNGLVTLDDSGHTAYRRGVDFLAAVRYLSFIWVVSGANHRTRGSWDASGANGIGARLADWQSLLLKPRPFSYATGTPPRVCWPWNCWTTWKTVRVLWINLTNSKIITKLTKPSLIPVCSLTEVWVSSLSVVCRGTALRFVAGCWRRCSRGGRGSGVFASSIGDGTRPDSS